MINVAIRKILQKRLNSMNISSFLLTKGLMQLPVWVKRRQLGNPLFVNYLETVQGTRAMKITGCEDHSLSWSMNRHIQMTLSCTNQARTCGRHLEGRQSELDAGEPEAECGNGGFRVQGRPAGVFNS